MEATAMALGQILPCSSSYVSAAHSSSSVTGSRISCGLVNLGRIRSGSEMLTAGFCDQSHLQYYSSKIGCSSSMMSEKHENRGKDKSLKKMKKKQLKLLKGLTRDLSTFSQIGFGLDSDGALLDQVKGDMLSVRTHEATEILLQRLQKVKAEEKELKGKRKEEKARSKAAALMQIGINCEASSSSSSSDSRDSECGETIDMNTLKLANAMHTDEPSPPFPAPIIPTIPDEKMDLRPRNVDMNADDETGPSGLVFDKKIEVCMGGKCRKSGGGALLEEFERAVGIEGAVCGCKCMGKCRDGPNVRVVGGGEGEIPARAPAKSVCVGVGLEDVNMIVANFFGEKNQCLLAAAPAI